MCPIWMQTRSLPRYWYTINDFTGDEMRLSASLEYDQRSADQYIEYKGSYEILRLGRKLYESGKGLLGSLPIWI